MRLAAVVVLVLGGATIDAGARAQSPESGGERVHLIVKKSARTLSLYDEHAPKPLVKTYRVALGSSPTGPKQVEGDGATPEGEYYVTHGNAQSKFHLSLGLSYPNAADAERGMARGIITPAEHRSILEAIGKHERPPQHTKLGGDVFVHGGGTSSDWTAGCIALDDKDIDELFARVPIGARVTVLP